MNIEAVRSSFEDTGGAETIKAWVDGLRSSSTFFRQRIPFARMRQWAFDDDGILRHETGRFFSIEGRKITDLYLGKTRHQPIINQPEHGILGILTQERNGVQKFLLQAKIEPGNRDVVQLSPTVQATESNYMKTHKGRSVPLIEYFRGTPTCTATLFSELQSEHGWKFLGKSNRNIIVEASPDMTIEHPDTFAWLSLGDINELLKHEHYINMDSRSVLACLPPPEQTNASALASWLKPRKRNRRYVSEPCSMAEVYAHGWERTEDAIRSDENPDFSLFMLDIAVDREVSSWIQPIVEDANPKLHGMVVAPFADGWKMLVQACEEGCSADGVEIGPTVHNDSPTAPACRFGGFFTGERGTVLYDRMQSEEGGRFLEYVNRYAVTAADAPFDAPDGYRWASVDEVKALMHRPCFVNIEARTLIACMPHTISRQEVSP